MKALLAACLGERGSLLNSLYYSIIYKCLTNTVEEIHKQSLKDLLGIPLVSYSPLLTLNANLSYTNKGLEQ